MSSILLTAAAVEPVTLAEAKAYLRVEHDDDDDVIAALIAGARIHVEAQTRRALITQSWRLVRDAWPADGRHRGAAGAAAQRSSPRASTTRTARRTRSIRQAFVVDNAAAPAVIAFAPWCAAGAGPRRRPASRSTSTVGYGDAAADVPRAAAPGDPPAGRALVREPRPDRDRPDGRACCRRPSRR